MQRALVGFRNTGLSATAVLVLKAQCHCHHRFPFEYKRTEILQNHVVYSIICEPMNYFASGVHSMVQNAEYLIGGHGM